MMFRTRIGAWFRVRLVRIGLRIVLGSVAVCACGACDDRGIEQHFVDIGVEERIPGKRSGAGHDAPRDVSWIVPSGWQRDPQDRPMRFATFLAPGSSGLVEVAVTRLAGRGGGELANVNRWRDQMGLAPISADELSGLRRFDGPGIDGYFVRIEGADSVLLVAGVYQTASDHTWFVRAVTTRSGADRLERELLSFAHSIAGAEVAGGSD